MAEVRLRQEQFQHTAARRRLLTFNPAISRISQVSTHSRAEAAAFAVCILFAIYTVSTHSRAEAAAFATLQLLNLKNVSTHSRAEAAA